MRVGIYLPQKWDFYEKNHGKPSHNKRFAVGNILVIYSKRVLQEALNVLNFHEFIFTISVPMELPSNGNPGGYLPIRDNLLHRDQIQYFLQIMS